MSDFAWCVYVFGNRECFIGSVVSRYRNKGKEEDGESGAATSKHDRSARLSSAMQRLDFVTKTPEKQKEISKEFEDREF